MLEIKNYTEDLQKEYSRFCKKNISFLNYHSKPTHIAWLRDYRESFFKVAINNNKIVGCLHGYRSPLILDGKTEMAMNLHNLYSDPDYKGSGMKLLMETIREEDLKILAHATGKLAIAYEKIGSIKIESTWAKKFIIPNKIFSSKQIRNDSLYDKFLLKGLNILSNKNLKERSTLLGVLKNLELFDNDITDDFIEWRFFHKFSPITYTVQEPKTESSLLFSIGKKNFIPFVRVFSLQLKESENPKNLLDCVESIAASYGIPIVIVSITSDVDLMQYNYKPYKNMPEAFCHSSSRRITDCKIDGISTDVAFNSFV